MHNKPKYTLFKNTTYALAGLVDIVKHERSFKLQLVLFVVGTVVAWLLPIEIEYKLVLSISLIIPIMAEIANSAIERVVDLVTKEYHILAKQAKDAGAALVFVSLVTLAAIWVSTLALAFKLV
ncbi:MAG: diacylglycerol kinase [Helicobacteraceae bacterium]|jgi:diacylglycerol kinase (ATP)|nr:diacylglycerol kinase [Helicobacteraceae bacterium]